MIAMNEDGRTGFNFVTEYPINPKALNLGELYGEYNLSTGEWLDGVISSIMRKTCAGVVYLTKKLASDIFCYISHTRFVLY